MTSNDRRGGLSPNLRDELLALISHELRTPLTVIAGASRVLNRHPSVAEDPGLTAVVEDLAGATRRMERVIGNMLLLASIETDLPRTEPVLLRLAVADAIASVEKDFPSVEIVILGSPDREVAVEAVPAWVRLILVNLLTNAYVHGARARQVVVQWEQDGDVVRVQVCSSGDPQEPDILERWFEPFYHRTRTDEYPGAGLGLTVARSLARGQGGELVAESWDSEPGTRMVLTLPAVGASHPGAEPENRE